MREGDLWLTGEWAIPGNWPARFHQPVVRTVSGRIPPMPLDDDNDDEEELE